MASGPSGGGVEMPTDLRNALAEEPSAQEAWEKLSPEQQKAHIADLDSGPEPVARERCLRRLIGELSVQTSRR